MTQIKWVPLEIVITIHDRQISRHGGASGIRDLGLLESALARPQNLKNYGDPSIFELGASYAFGIAKAHAFVDGNKRTAFQSCFVFLYINGADLQVNNDAVVQMMEGLASDQVSESEFAKWLESSSEHI